jgi:hypothetical protein
MSRLAPEHTVFEHANNEGALATFEIRDKKAVVQISDKLLKEKDAASQLMYSLHELEHRKQFLKFAKEAHGGDVEKAYQEWQKLDSAFNRIKNPSESYSQIGSETFRDALKYIKNEKAAQQAAYETALRNGVVSDAMKDAHVEYMKLMDNLEQGAQKALAAK